MRLLTRLSGEAKYAYKEENRYASLLLNLRPEIYGGNNSQNIFKGKVAANYSQKEDLLGWGLNVSRQRNIYRGNTDHYNYDMFFLTGETEWYFVDNTPLTLNIGYAYQKVDFDASQHYDILFTEVRALSTLPGMLRLGYGLYIEYFDIENEFSPDTESRIEILNSGYRWGPQLSLNYLQDFIFNFDYNFFIHNSDFTQAFSYEQLFRLVSGTIFLEDFSIFLLIDYYKRNLKVKENYSEGITPLYVPMNLENRVYVKLGYDLSDLTELYIKAGYLKEDLYDNKYSFSGWHLLAGIQFGN
ncbi:MAG: hypothetical protein R6W90_03025 [Ignavibacteriaceae bacterium]